MIKRLCRWLQRRPPEPARLVIISPKRSRPRGDYEARITDVMRVKKWHDGRTGTDDDVAALERAAAVRFKEALPRVRQIVDDGEGDDSA